MPICQRVLQPAIILRVVNFLQTAKLGNQEKVMISRQSVNLYLEKKTYTWTLLKLCTTVTFADET